MDKIICICGESGSGKSTIGELLAKEGYKYINSFTTRKERYSGERGHIFTTEKQYQSNKAQGTIVAETIFDKERYWTTRGQFSGTCIYVVDVAGIKDLKQKMKDIEIVVIYLKCDEKERFERIFTRSLESNATFKEAINKAGERIIHDREVFKIIQVDTVVDSNRPMKDVFKDVLEVIREV
jgi:guanylate kinase